MAIYRSKIGSPGEILTIVAENMHTALDACDATIPALQALGVAVSVGNGVLDVLGSESRLPQRLDQGDKLEIKRGRTFVFDGDASTSETLAFTGVGKRTERLVLDSELGQRLVLDVAPGQRREVRLEPGERITVHNNFRRP